MFKTLPALLPLIAAASFGPALACGQSQSSSTAKQAADTRAATPKPTKHVLATVNGMPIGDADVRLALKSSSGGHNKAVPSEHLKNVLDRIVLQELIHQRAVELGLDANPGYQERLRSMEARINAFKRKELSDLFWREIAQKAVITEAEAKTYFTDNAARIRTELHVWQLLWRKGTQAERAASDLMQGETFEDLALERFPRLPKTGSAPWDLGYLRWKQVPKSWRSVVYGMKKGEVSGVIRGPNNRFWIIKLIDNRENPDITFQSIKPTVMEVLKNEKIQRLREQINRELRAKASIVHLRDPAAITFPEEE